LAEGLGSDGASYKLRKYISVTPSSTVLTEDYPPFRWSEECANPGKDSWCKPIPAPEDIDLDEIDGGACKPHIAVSPDCPLFGQDVGELAQNIVGAAGQHAKGVPGSLLLAVVANEQEWLYSYEMKKRPNGEEYKYFLPNLMNWDDASVASYSEPFSARIPNCSTQNFTAQGPFGFITYDTEGGNTFESAIKAGGWHPSRRSQKYALEIASQCNFIDGNVLSIIIDLVDVESE